MKIVKLTLLILFCIALLSFGCKKNEVNTTSGGNTSSLPLPIPKSNKMKVYAHYMVWFETNVSSGTGQWGWHWTMTNDNPNIMDSTGRRQIASWFYPLIGPYASGDPNVIEYHLLLMKYAGIDGVIMDWYGIHSVNDYAGICKNASAVANMVGKTGLGFAVCYEDQTLGPVVTAGAAGSYVAGAQDDMNFLNSEFFPNSAYIQVNKAPLLLDFGPTTMTGASNWTQALSVLTPQPYFMPLWYHTSLAGSVADGEFAWVYENTASLSSFYDQAQNIQSDFGGAYPGFQDYYAQGGGGASLGWTIGYQNTLPSTLQMAQSAGLDYLQLITWNDFGEGTMLEPTREFGYKSLEAIQNFTGVSMDTTVFYSISQQYALRVKFAGVSSAQESLDKSFQLFVTLQPQKAVQILDSLQVSNAKK